MSAPTKNTMHFRHHIFAYDCLQELEIPTSVGTKALLKNVSRTHMKINAQEGQGAKKKAGLP